MLTNTGYDDPGPAGAVSPRDGQSLHGRHAAGGYRQAVATLLGVAERTGSRAARWAADYLAADPDRLAPTSSPPAPPTACRPGKPSRTTVSKEWAERAQLCDDPTAAAEFVRRAMNSPDGRAYLTTSDWEILAEDFLGASTVPAIHLVDGGQGAHRVCMVVPNWFVVPLTGGSREPDPATGLRRVRPHRDADGVSVTARWTFEQHEPGTHLQVEGFGVALGEIVGTVTAVLGLDASIPAMIRSGDTLTGTFPAQPHAYLRTQP